MYLRQNKKYLEKIFKLCVCDDIYMMYIHVYIYTYIASPLIFQISFYTYVNPIT